MLPSNDDDLEVLYTGDEVTQVGTNDTIRVSQNSTTEYTIHQFKNFVGGATSGTPLWEGQTNLLPSTSNVVLEIYNVNTTAWVEIDRDNSSPIDTDFTLTATVDLADYKNTQNVVCCRVYQQGV